MFGGVALLVLGQAAAGSISFAGQVVSSIFPHCDSRGEVRDKPCGGRIDTSKLNGLPESAAVARERVVWRAAPLNLECIPRSSVLTVSGRCLA